MGLIREVGSRLLPALIPPELGTHVVESSEVGSIRMSGGGAGDAPYGGHFVPAGVTVSQILDYARGTGSDDAFGYYHVGLGYGRDVAVTYAALHRCVTLIAGVIAELMTDGLWVRDRDGGMVKGTRINAILDVISRSPDDGLTSGTTFIEDAAADYLMDGNALIVPQYEDGSYRLHGLVRYNSWNSDTLPHYDTQVLVYRLTPIREYSDMNVQYESARDVVHVRWPLMTRHGRRRAEFALAPILALRPTLDIGLRGDRYINTWFSKGAQPKLHLDYEQKEWHKLWTPDQRAEAVGYVLDGVMGRDPLVTFGAKSSKINDPPQDREAGKLREFQVRECGMFYGIPAPAFGIEVSNWGQGIEMLNRLMWRTGIKPHLKRFLDALTIKLLRPGEKFDVDTTALLRGDSESMAKLIAALGGDAQRAPVATRVEQRHIAGLPRDPDGEYVDPPMASQREQVDAVVEKVMVRMAAANGTARA